MAPPKYKYAVIKLVQRREHPFDKTYSLYAMVGNKGHLHPIIQAIPMKHLINSEELVGLTITKAQYTIQRILREQQQVWKLLRNEPETTPDVGIFGHSQAERTPFAKQMMALYSRTASRNQVSLRYNGTQLQGNKT